MKLSHCRVFCLVGFLAAVPLGAQDAKPPVPQIVTSSVGEVQVAPDRATISLGVQSRAATAADAATQNSRKQRAVIDAVKSKGIAAEQIATTAFNVIPETQYDQRGQAAPKTTSYLVMNTVTVDVRRIDQVGPVIDAALAAGANQVNSLAFTVSAADSVRRVALANAVSKSRADAEAMARAAGGSLGSLIELTAGDIYSPPVPLAYGGVRAEMKQAVPIEPGQETIRATVTARWQFISGSR